MHGADGLAGGDFVADLFVDHQAHSGVDGIFFLLAAAAEHHASDADAFAIDAGDKPRLRGGELDRML